MASNQIIHPDRQGGVIFIQIGAGRSYAIEDIQGNRSALFAPALKFARQFFRAGGGGLQFTNAALQGRQRLQVGSALEQFAGVFQMLGHAATRFARVLAPDGDENAPVQ